MRVCRKCSKRVSAESRICRDCGAILEDIPEDSLPSASTKREASSSGSPFAAKSEKADLGQAEEPVVAEVVVEPSKVAPSKTNETPDQRRTAPVQREADDQQPTGQHPQASGSEQEAQQRPPQAECRRCGSDKMMHDVTVVDQGERSNGSLTVVIYGDPGAVLFKDRLYGQLKADICGECGHVELRVLNPKQLYKHFLKSQRGHVGQ